MARPERVFTDEEIEEIKELAPVITQDQLAEYFSITSKTLRDIFKRDRASFYRLYQSQIQGWCTRCEDTA